MGHIKQISIKNQTYYFFNDMINIEDLDLSLIKIDNKQYLIKIINGDEAAEYDKDFMKIRFESDDNSVLGKILKIHMLTVIAKSVFEENGKYYPQFFLDECLYEI